MGSNVGIALDATHTIAHTAVQNRSMANGGDMNADRVVALVRGAAKSLPLLPSVYRRLRPPPSQIISSTASYCYGVWAKHLSSAHDSTGCPVPDVVLEMGPGVSLALGVAALLSGAKKYIGADAVPLLSPGATANAASQLVQMFQARAKVTFEGWPDFSGLLDERGFPSSAIPEETLSESLEIARVASILDAANLAPSGVPPAEELLSYIAPFFRSSVQPNSVDFALSHSVLEHVDNLASTLSTLFLWLKPGGLMSHQVDFRSHNITRSWDGHRAYNSVAWKVVLKGRRYPVNRFPCSLVIAEIEKAGFQVIKALRNRTPPTLRRSELCREWRNVSDEDIETESLFIQARKPL